MNVIRHTDAAFAATIRSLTTQSSLFDPTIEERARVILQDVLTRGDAALLELTERFDGAKLTTAQLAVTKAELSAALARADEGLRAAVETTRRNVEFFSRKSLRKNWSAKNAQGATVGEKFDPFQRVGIYIPGGTAPLVSTALMTVTLAKVAGCPEIVVCTPCGRDGSINPALLYAARAAGATEIYRAGGAQAVAAMAYGTATIRRVQKIFGPGNAYVVAAKRLLFGRVAVDLLPGPSEVLVLADDTANPRFVAADLLAQAEHGSGHERVWLVTTSATVLSAVEKEIARQLAGQGAFEKGSEQGRGRLVPEKLHPVGKTRGRGRPRPILESALLPSLTRREFIQRALDNSGWLIQVKSLDDAIALVNELAPEHCEVMTRKAARVAQRILTAGAIFLGGYSPTVLGDYVAGPSHELPTGGAGASFGGLTVDQFQRRTSVVEYNRAALKKSLATVKTFAEVEGLDAHGRSAEIRT